ncbi:transposon Tf2-1 polyprotein [Mercurialis annua]|uniref:transposon Tf2-1 polyprotein n=1 Tax=Mercurialis annua TaxID=3986 RepID=UPI0024AD4CCE|nr:transposon Tf2-1 polyprotein [Mercurialis annua]
MGRASFLQISKEICAINLLISVFKVKDKKIKDEVILFSYWIFTLISKVLGTLIPLIFKCFESLLVCMNVFSPLIKPIFGSVKNEELTPVSPYVSLFKICFWHSLIEEMLFTSALYARARFKYMVKSGSTEVKSRAKKNKGKKPNMPISEGFNPSFGPITRSRSQASTNLVSKPATLVMGDPNRPIQSQLEEFMAMYKSEQAAQHERQQQLADQLDHITRLTNTLQSQMATKDAAEGSQNRSVFDGSHDSPNNTANRGGRIQRDRTNQGDRSTTADTGGFVPRFTKLDFPRFNGTADPIVWLSCCDNFFLHQHTIDEDKVILASFHLEGDAQLWFLKLQRDRPNISWDNFKVQCQLRFGPPIRSSKLGELSKLKQSSTVEDYQRQFERLSAQTTTLTSEQEKEIFISGLREALAVEVELHNPADLTTAMSLARLYERRSEKVRAESFTPRRLTTTPANNSGPKPSFIKRLSRPEMEERRAKGLCFNCDEKFEIGHRCKKLFWLEVLVEEDEPDDEEPAISFHAISGTQTTQTMQVEGIINGFPLLVLIDSGSTHSFVNEALIHQLHIQAEAKSNLRVMVANGEQVKSPGVCRKLPIQMGTQIFPFDLFLLPLCGFGAVLGVNWLKTLGTICWDFATMKMQFKWEGSPVELNGCRNSTLPNNPSLSSMKLEAEQGLQLQKVHSEFNSIFSIPVGLPPERSCDHRIFLEPGTEPVVVRPYRYPHLQKDEIEAQCAEMLKQGMIRPSNSPYSSPVLLVKKTDNSWRFCVDYRALNAKTIKDKFPIPVIEELLEELHGAIYFSKLDLRSGYHQVRMNPYDVEKTAFRTHHGHFEFLVMPFGLTNAPSTFQSLMNDVFQKYLRKFVLVFFDDILVYSQTWEDHLHHLRIVFSLLQQHQLFLKESKCSLAQTQISYLGHIISEKGVMADAEKIESMVRWPQPTTLKALRGFLGLTGYYRKFVQNYGLIAAPLTNMLRKNSFVWNRESLAAFDHLKRAMTTTPVLALPDFQQDFLVECDASEFGMGAVLQQGDRPIAYFSKPMAARHFKLPAYEKELIALAQAIRHWRPYLWGRKFLIRTDHYSLKYLLDQRITTLPQQKWVSKLLGYDFQVEYKAGKENKVADALSRRDEEMGLLASISGPQLDLFQSIKDANMNSKTGQQLIAQIRANSSPPGYQKTFTRIAADFYWPQMKKSIQDFIKSCGVCQKNKTEALQPAGLLQPLPVPSQVWSDISMDFIDALPPSSGKSVLFVVVDRFSKYAHFIPMSHPYSAVSVARIFFDNIYKLHGLPETIVSDRDVIFTSAFWTELFKLSGTKLAFSSAYHPQSDGQTEVVNRTIEVYLRCFTSDQPRRWAQWISWAEYCYNTGYHSSLKTTPFEVVYGRPPPRLLSYCPGLSRLEAVDQELQTRDKMVADIKERLLRAQDIMKTNFDKYHQALDFEVGDWVLLKLQPNRQLSLASHRNRKLSPRFYGPFMVEAKIGKVAYRLQLHAHVKIHPVFHVSCLKRFQGTIEETTPTFPKVRQGEVLPSPKAILDKRIIDKDIQILIHWDGLSPADASWESSAIMEVQYPEFAFEVKRCVKEGTDVMNQQLNTAQHTNGKLIPFANTYKRRYPKKLMVELRKIKGRNQICP